MGDKPRLQPGFNAQFTQHVCHMKLDRAFGDVQSARDTAVGTALAEKLEYFRLARGEQRDPFQLRLPGGRFVTAFTGGAHASGCHSACGTTRGMSSGATFHGTVCRAVRLLLPRSRTLFRCVRTGNGDADQDDSP